MAGAVLPCTDRVGFIRGLIRNSTRLGYSTLQVSLSCLRSWFVRVCPVLG